MTSIGDRLRQRNQEVVAQLTPAERVEAALRLGDDDVHVFAARQGDTLEGARRRLRRQRQVGRTRCSFLETTG